MSKESDFALLNQPSSRAFVVNWGFLKMSENLKVKK